jgi:hypothetical protein
MKELKVNTEGLVIGSATMAEYKYQTIAFMERVYLCIVEDRDYGLCGYSNLRPWTHNLCTYISSMEKLNPNKYQWENVEDLHHLVMAIRLNLESITKKSSKDYVREVKALCVSLWEDLLRRLTRIFHLEYERID